MISLVLNQSFNFVMLKSNLCERIELCKSIETLSKDGCLAVIRLMSNIISNNNLNCFLINIVLNSNGILSNNHLQEFGKEFEQLLSSHPQYIQQPSKTITSHKQEKQEKQQKEQLFPLLRLPIDLITNTSLYLDEKDIFQFEQCCRLFYTMINNTKYLKQSNNFKTFIVDNERFDQLTQSQYSFFKYSKATTLEFENTSHVSIDHRNEEVDEFFDNLQNQWRKIEAIDRNGDIFDNIFKSIKSLEFQSDGMALLGKMPVRILFDDESQLETIKFNHYWSNDDPIFTKYTQYQFMVQEFEENYESFKYDIEQQGKK